MRAYVPKVSILILLVAGLACGASQREATISAAVTAVNASRDAFAVYDSAEQAKIVAAATSLAEGQAALIKYRADRVKTEKLIGNAYRAIAIASTVNDQPSLDGLKAAVELVIDALKSFNLGGDK